MSEVLYKYIGDGGYVVGIPARDILVSETDYHETAEANSKTPSPCYVKVSTPVQDARTVKVAKGKDAEPVVEQAGQN